jgi:hypothetical protein
MKGNQITWWGQYLVYYISQSCRHIAGDNTAISGPWRVRRRVVRILPCCIWCWGGRRRIVRLLQRRRSGCLRFGPRHSCMCVSKAREGIERGGYVQIIIPICANCSAGYYHRSGVSRVKRILRPWRERSGFETWIEERSSACS